MKKFTKVLAAASCVALMAVGAVACQPKTDTDKVFVLTYDNKDPNMSGLWKPGFEKYDSDYGFEVAWTDAASDEAKAMEAIDAAVASGEYSAYFLNPVDNKNVKLYINKVKKTEKPCIIWNRKGDDDTEVMNSYDKAYYVGIDPAEGGVYQGEMAAEYLLGLGTNTDGTLKADRNKDGKIGYVVLLGDSGHPDAKARTEASPKALAKSLGDKASTAEISIIEGKDNTGNTWDPVTAGSELEKLLTDSDVAATVDVVLSNNDGMAIGALDKERVKTLGIPVFGVDALDDAIQSIKEGRLKGTIKNDGATQAKVCLLVARNIIDGKDATEGYSEIEGNMPYLKDGKQFRIHQIKVTKESLK